MLKERLNRPLNLGDFILFNDYSTLEYGIVISDKSIFDGFTVRVFKNLSVYLIQNPSAEEFDIKNDILNSYSKYQASVLQSKKTQALKKALSYEPFDILTLSNSGSEYEYIYLGKCSMTFDENTYSSNVKLPDKERCATGGHLYMAYRFYEELRDSGKLLEMTKVYNGVNLEFTQAFITKNKSKAFLSVVGHNHKVKFPIQLNVTFALSKADFYQTPNIAAPRVITCKAIINAL
jgi:hypothetical protein